MRKIRYVEPGTYLFRYMDPRAPHFWSAVSDMLVENELFLNSRTKFNDPYDSQPIMIDDLRPSTIRAYFEELIEKPFNPIRSTESIAQILEMKSTGKTHLTKAHVCNIRADLRKVASEVLDTAGLLSFSMDAENLLLWAHYAASFTGLCAVFKRGASARSALSVCAKVEYVRERPRLRQSLLHELAVRRMADEPCDEIADEVFFLSFLHKSNDWEHEQEARIFHQFHAFKKMQFDPRELIGFILGPNCSNEVEAKMTEEISAHRPSLSLYRSYLSKTEFRIVIPHQFISHHTRAA